MDELQAEQVRSVEEAEIHVRNLAFRVRALERQVRAHQNLVETMDTPLWKKAIFVLDGWPLFRVVKRPQWRPWRRWWTS